MCTTGAACAMKDASITCRFSGASGSKQNVDPVGFIKLLIKSLKAFIRLLGNSINFSYNAGLFATPTREALAGMCGLLFFPLGHCNPGQGSPLEGLPVYQ